MINFNSIYLFIEQFIQYNIIPLIELLLKLLFFFLKKYFEELNFLGEMEYSLRIKYYEVSILLIPVFIKHGSSTFSTYMITHTLFHNIAMPNLLSR